MLETHNDMLCEAQGFMVPFALTACEKRLKYRKSAVAARLVGEYRSELVTGVWSLCYKYLEESEIKIPHNSVL